MPATETQEGQLVITPENQAWAIHEENIRNTDFLKTALVVGTGLVVLGEAGVGAMVHPIVCGLIPFTLAAAVYAYRRVDKHYDDIWRRVWLKPHRMGVGEHGETEAMLAANAKPIDNAPQQLRGG